MNKLRILPLAFLLWPAFASAACLPSQVCEVTSGTAVVGVFGAPCPANNPTSSLASFRECRLLTIASMLGHQWNSGHWWPLSR